MKASINLFVSCVVLISSVFLVGCTSSLDSVSTALSEPSKEQIEEFNIYCDNGYALLGDGKYEDALKSFEKADSIIQGDITVGLGMATCYTLLGDCDTAILWYDAIIESDLKDVDKIKSAAYFGKSKCLIELKKLDEAEATINQALQFDPSNEGAISLRENWYKLLPPEEGIEVYFNAFNSVRDDKLYSILSSNVIAEKGKDDIHNTAYAYVSGGVRFSDFEVIDVDIGEKRAIVKIELVVNIMGFRETVTRDVKMIFEDGTWKLDEFILPQ